MLITQIVKQVFHCIHHHIPFSSSPIGKGLKVYMNCNDGDKKSILKVIWELEKLSSYWHAFPDSYFRFGMFMKDFNDINRMKSFVPQGAYAAYCKDFAYPAKYDMLIDDKILFHDIMQQYGLPVPYRFFIFRGNRFRKGVEILSDKHVDEIISSITDERIFVKRFTGGAASGVSIFTKKGDVFVNAEGERVSASMIRRQYANQDFIFEKQIKQEEVLRKFNPDTVNTIRVLTYNNKIISASVRFGAKGDYIDNVSKGGVAVSLDIESGKLGRYGMRMYDVKKYYEHPDTHLAFDGVVVTQWPEVKAVVEKSMLYLPYFKSVGYDVATTDEGPIIIEINTGAGIGLSQMGKEYGLRDYFKEGGHDS